MTEPAQHRAEAAIAELGERVTAARRLTLGVLLDAEQPLSHVEIEATLARNGARMDRVTLYRVLDWLVSRRLAHKIEGHDRVWRFSAAAGDSHAHFSCTRCGGVYCLAEIKPVFAVSLPPGFRSSEATLSLKGLCPTCSP
jgi:Fur family ferric uptake transcriptional regulator